MIPLAHPPHPVMLDRAGDSEIEVEDDDDLGEDELEDGEPLEQDEK